MDTNHKGVVELLCSSLKLERDKGVIELERQIPVNSKLDNQRLQTNLLRLLQNSDISWEMKQGCLLGAKALIPYLNTEDDCDIEFLHEIQRLSERLLTDIEVRVRLAAGETLGTLCYKLGPCVYTDTKSYLLKLIQNNLEKNIEDDSSKLEQYETEKLMKKLTGNASANQQNSTEFQDTAGWKNLETSLKALQAMIEGCNVNFQPFVDEELLTLLFTTLLHSNRFVRETGYYVCSSLVSCGDSSKDSELRDSITAVNPLFTYGNDFCKHLAMGLADNWSQVRLSASVAARQFLLSLPDNNSRQVFYPSLLPRLCLNRYYVADGVRIYSQETWRQVTGVSGKDLVEKFIDPTVEYYKEATTTDNHAVREAACACIAELAAKISPEAVSPYVNTLLQTLLNCFQDDSWPVRDAACLACGNFVLSFPSESKPALESLYPMFYRNLSDPISSVRQGAATSLANVVRAYGNEALSNVMNKTVHGLKGIKNQQESEKILNLDKVGVSKYGVLKRIRDNEPEVHSGTCVYSCSSLGPKLGRGNSSDVSYVAREHEPWEVADGFVHLLGELSYIVEAHKEVEAVIPLVVESARHRHYLQHVTFLETVCKLIPVLAKNLGKRVFKSHIDSFLEPVFYSLECENALTSSAASQCLNQIAAFLGPNILRARVNLYSPQYLQKLESVIYLAPF